jgi:hypothetical protein
VGTGPTAEWDGATREAAGLARQALDEAGQPLRERVLYERVLERGGALSDDEFVALMAEMATLGMVRLSVEHDRRAGDPEPFGPRFYLPAG